MTQKAKEAAGMYSIGTIDLYQFLDCCTSIEEAKEAMDAFEMEVLPLKVELNRACWRAREIGRAWASYDREALRNKRELRLKRIADENPKYPSYEEWIMALEQLHKTYTEEELQASYDEWEHRKRLHDCYQVGYNAAVRKVAEATMYRFLREYQFSCEEMSRFWSGYYNYIYGLD